MRVWLVREMYCVVCGCSSTSSSSSSNWHVCRRIHVHMILGWIDRRWIHKEMLLMLLTMMMAMLIWTILCRIVICDCLLLLCLSQSLSVPHPISTSAIITTTITTTTTAVLLVSLSLRRWKLIGYFSSLFRPLPHSGLTTLGEPKSDTSLAREDIVQSPRTLLVCPPTCLA